MRNSLTIVSTIFITGCASVPILSQQKPPGSNFAHVVTAPRPQVPPEQLAPGALITEILHPNGTSIAMPLDGATALDNFYIASGRYRLRFICTRWKVEMPLYTEVDFISNQQYEYSCSHDLPRLIVKAK